MAKRKHAITLADIGKIYQISRQGAAWLVKHHGFDVTCNPDRLFSEKLGTKATPLRSNLSNPDFRERCRRAFNVAPFCTGLREGYRKAYKPTKILQTLNPNKIKS